MDTSSIVGNLLGVKGHIRRIQFRESGRSYSCLVWDDSLWGAVKDNLILCEYERGGVTLAQTRRLVVDVGAHVGLFSLRASSHAQQVVALEPHPSNFSLLTLNLERNEASNVDALQVALSSSADGAVLVEGPGSGGHALGGPGSHTWEVETLGLEDLVSRYGPVDLLKIDIEGSEFGVFDAASDDVLLQISTIVGELHLQMNQGRDEMLAERLRRLGFRVTLLEPPILEWRESILRLFRNWRKSRDLFRVKILVLAIYAIAPVIAGILRDPERMNDRIRFLYASMEAPLSRRNV